MADEEITEPEVEPETGEPGGSDEPKGATEQEPAPPSKTPIPPAVERALRKANKEAETLRLKLKEYEDRDKTEAERLADRADAAEKRAADAEAQLLRAEVAAEKGLTAKQARRMVGATREELEADADDLLDTFGSSKEPAAAPEPEPEPDPDGGRPKPARTPPERLRPGGMPTPKEPTLPEQIAAAEKAGNWPEARRLKTRQLVEMTTVQQT